jgi:hypothetical protein
VVLVTAVRAVAAHVTWRMPGRMKAITADPLTYFQAASSLRVQ